jgi:RNA polymerase sigma factor (sigma-70 family)
VVVNAAREQGRKRTELPEPTVSRNGTEDEEPDARVRVALALLPERERLALFLRYYADLDYRTIGETLGVAIGTVGVTLNSARAKLRQLLAEAPR